MSVSEYELVQKAVNIVNDSPHKTNKIAAALWVPDGPEDGRIAARTNFYPKEIADTLGTEDKIGNASPTVHAEFAVLIPGGKTEGASMAITDLFCPNCAKYMAEAGVKAVYIDHKGFDKDWAKRNGKDFEHMSMKIAQHAGISVYVVNRKERKTVPIWEAPEDYTPDVESPLELKSIAGNEEIDMPSLFGSYVRIKEEKMSEPFAAGFMRDGLGNYFAACAQAHPAVGYTSETMDKPEGKYSFILQPCNRLMMAAARSGYKIDPDYFYSSRVPTSRELVNAVGAGLTKIHLGTRADSRGPNGPLALKQLEDAKVIEVVDVTHPEAIAAGPRLLL